jgi:AcrR family transcriptional regulator
MAARPDPHGRPATSKGTEAPTARHLEKRELLLDAAARCFNERGVRGAGLAAIGASVGLGTTSVTYYFRRKEDLAVACMLRAIETFSQLADEAASASGVEARIERFASSFGQLLIDIESGAHPQLISFNDVRALTGPAAGTVFAAYTQMFRRMRELLRGVATTGLTADEFNARAHLTVSAFNAFRSWASRYEPDDFPSRLEHLVDVLLHGVGTGRSTGRALDLDMSLPEQRAGDTPSDFLRVAAHLINEQGFRGVSIEQIAARLNLTKGSFYHHLDTKHDLIVACFKHSFEVLREALRQAAAAQGCGAERLEAMATALMRHQMSEAGPLLRWSAVSAMTDPAERDAVTRSIRRLQERMEGLLIEGMQDGSIRVLDQSVTAQYLLQAINAAVELPRWVRHVGISTVPALFVRPVLEGVLSPCAASAQGAGSARLRRPADPIDPAQRPDRSPRRMAARSAADART